jgi:predicted O-methyltransferase YrrM
MKKLPVQLNIINELKLLCESKEWFYPEDSDQDPLDYGVHSKTETIKAWHIPETTGQFLYFIVNLLQPSKILELGTSIGYSALWMGIAAQNYGGHIDTLEYYDEKIKIAKSYIEKADLKETITVHKKKILKYLEDTDVAYDFIFMDADKGNYLSYYNFIKEKSNQDCVIFVDNAGNFKHRMQDLIEEVKTDNSVSVSFLNMDNGILMIQFGKKNSNLFNSFDVFGNYPN